MHKLAEKMADCLKAKVEGMGIDNIEGAALEELGKWVDILKDIACYDKDMRIIKAMDEAEENEEKMKYIEEYEDYPEMEERRYYRGQPRDSRGRYMSRRGRGRMGYEEPMTYRMTPDMYRQMPIDWERDMDREGMGRMYYTGGSMANRSQSTGSESGQSSGGSGMSGGNMGGGTRGYSDGNYGGNDGNRGGGNSRYENARRGYEEKKTMGADKQEKMKSLEEYMKTIAEELTQAVEGASPEERAMIKAKLNTVATKM